TQKVLHCRRRTLLEPLKFDEEQCAVVTLIDAIPLLLRKRLGIDIETKHGLQLMVEPFERDVVVVPRQKRLDELLDGQIAGCFPWAIIANVLADRLKESRYIPGDRIPEPANHPAPNVA